MRSNDAPRPASLDEVLSLDQSARRQAMSLLENTALV
jgi:1-deoxy-D-xylulose-5-phosphate reductoisomerase